MESIYTILDLFIIDMHNIITSYSIISYIPLEHAMGTLCINTRDITIYVPLIDRTKWVELPHRIIGDRTSFPHRWALIVSDVWVIMMWQTTSFNHSSTIMRDFNLYIPVMHTYIIIVLLAIYIIHSILSHVWFHPTHMVYIIIYL